MSEYINPRAILFFIVGFILSSICWHYAGIDYSDKTALSGSAMVFSMLIGAVGFLFGLER